MFTALLIYENKLLFLPATNSMTMKKKKKGGKKKTSIAFYLRGENIALNTLQMPVLGGINS